MHGHAVGGTGGVLVHSLVRLRHLLPMRRFCEPTLCRHYLPGGSCDGTDNRSDAGEQQGWEGGAGVMLIKSIPEPYPPPAQQ